MPRKSAKRSKIIHKKRKKGFSWKLLSKSKKVKRKIKRFGIIALLSFSSVVFLGGLIFHRSITKAFVSADSSLSFDINNADLSSVLLVTVEDLDSVTPEVKSLDLILLDRKNNKVVSIDVPLSWEVDIPGRYGEEELSKVLPVAMMNSEDMSGGAEILVESIEKKLAFNIDRFILMDSEISGFILDTFKLGKSRELLGYKKLVSLATSLTTDLTISEFYSYLTFINGLAPDRFINHSKSVEILEDGGYMNTVFRDLTFNSIVAKEGASVAVLNGSGVPGVAGHLALVMRNSGAYVIEVGNSSMGYEESMLIVSSKDLEIVKQIQRYFNVSNVVLKDEFDLEFAANKAEVCLIVGIDIANSL